MLAISIFMLESLLLKLMSLKRAESRLLEIVPEKGLEFLTKGQTPQNFTALNQFATQLAIAEMRVS